MDVDKSNHKLIKVGSTLLEVKDSVGNDSK